MQKQGKEDITVLIVQMSKQLQSLSHLPKIISQEIGFNRSPNSKFRKLRQVERKQIDKDLKKSFKITVSFPDS